MSLEFDGSNDIITIATANVVSGAGTVSMWMKFSVCGGNNMLYSGAAYNDFGMGQNWGFYPNGRFVPGEVQVPFNVWEFVSFVWNASIMNIYVNGILFSAKGSGASPGETCANLQIGRADFTGKIAEIRTYDYAQTVAQIKREMYRSITAEAGLTGYWRFDEGILNSGPAGTTAVDLSGLKHNGDDGGSMTDADYVPLPPITPLQDFM